MGEISAEIDKVIRDSGYTSNNAGRCCKCKTALKSSDVKVVLSSKTLGSTKLPLESRLLCSSCFVETSSLRRTIMKKSIQKKNRRIINGIISKQWNNR